MKQTIKVGGRERVVVERMWVRGWLIALALLSIGNTLGIIYLLTR